VPACSATHPRRAALIPAKESGAQLAMANGMGVYGNAELGKAEIGKLIAEMQSMKNRMDEMIDFGYLLSDL
jgi:hypothetical protein